MLTFVYFYFCVTLANYWFNLDSFSPRILEFVCTESYLQQSKDPWSLTGYLWAVFTFQVPDRAGLHWRLWVTLKTSALKWSNFSFPRFQWCFWVYGSVPYYIVNIFPLLTGIPPSLWQILDFLFLFSFFFFFFYKSFHFLTFFFITEILA